jgi:hypothetical protein
MSHPPIHHRDQALRRLSLATKGVVLGAILGTGGIAVGIAQATPAQPAKPVTSDPAKAGQSAGNQPGVQQRAVSPAAPSGQRSPATGAPPAGGGAEIDPPAEGTPIPPPQPPSPAPTVQSDQPAPPDPPEPTYSGGS